jgi:hypothetical protein
VMSKMSKGKDHCLKTWRMKRVQDSRLGWCVRVQGVSVIPDLLWIIELSWLRSEFAMNLIRKDVELDVRKRSMDVVNESVFGPKPVISERGTRLLF